MPSYVAFLRAINLASRRKFPKDAIRAAVESTGATEVETYINTGNVRLATRMRSRARVEEVLEDAFLADRGFEVRTIAFRADELTAIGADIRELQATRADLERHFVLLLKDQPEPETVAMIEALGDGTHQARIRGRACHLLLGPGYREGGTDPLRVERHLGVVTSRNHTVVGTLAERWGT